LIHPISNNGIGDRALKMGQTPIVAWVCGEFTGVAGGTLFLLLQELLSGYLF
jgi:uncharacterized membrane protein YeiH